MTRYELLVTLHILAAMVWIGSQTIYLVLHQYLHSRVARTDMFAVLHHTDRIAPFVFLPSIILTLTFGALMVATEDAWAFSDTWVSLGLTGLVAAFILGFVGGVPLAANLTKAKDRLGADSPEVSAASSRILALAYAETVILVGVVFVMVFKPGM